VRRWGADRFARRTGEAPRLWHARIRDSDLHAAVAVRAGARDRHLHLPVEVRVPRAGRALPLPWEVDVEPEWPGVG
jgi:hypothetical protein